MSGAIDILPPPPREDAAPELFRWFVSVRGALALEPVRTLAAWNFENAWNHYGDPYAGAGYWRRLGVVHLLGAVAGGTADHVFTLPVGFRPAATVRITSDESGTPALVEIDPDGKVWRRTGGNSLLSLDGIQFRQGG